MGSNHSKELPQATAHEIFGCVGCKLIPSPQVYSCGITGHLYCSGCATRFRFICVRMTENFKFICGNKVKAPLPTFLRTVFETAKFPCNYAAYGCNEILTSDRLPYHELICSFKSYPCPYGPKCLWKGTILKSNFAPHLMEYHGVRTYVNKDALTLDVTIRRPVLPRDSKVCIWTEVVLETKGVHFLLSFRYVKGLLCAWVWSFEPTFGYFFNTKICFISPNTDIPDEQRTTSWWGTAIPYEVPVEEILRQKLCMTLKEPECIQYEEDSATNKLLPWWRLRVELHCQQIRIDEPAIVPIRVSRKTRSEDVKAAVLVCYSAEPSKDNIVEETGHNGDDEATDSAEVEKCDEKASSEMNKADVKVFHSANESDSEREDGVEDKKEKCSGISKDHGTSNNGDLKNFYQKVKWDMKEKASNRKAKSSKNKKSTAKNNKKGKIN